MYVVYHIQEKHPVIFCMMRLPLTSFVLEDSSNKEFSIMGEYILLYPHPEAASQLQLQPQHEVYQE